MAKFVLFYFWDLATLVSSVAAGQFFVKGNIDFRKFINKILVWATVADWIGRHNEHISASAEFILYHVCL
jgi:hypothetical protein